MSNQYQVTQIQRGPLKVLNDAFVALVALFNKLNELITKHNALSLKTTAFSDLTSHPTTLEGYGITDGIKTGTQFPISEIIGLQEALDGIPSGIVTWDEITGKPTEFPPELDTRYYLKADADARFAPIDGPFPWTAISGKPSTLAGYGIVDAYTKAQINASLANKVNRIDDYLEGFLMQPFMMDQTIQVPIGSIMRVVGPFDIEASLDVAGTLEITS